MIGLRVEFLGSHNRRLANAHRALERVRKRGLSFAHKATLDDVAELLKAALARRWPQDVNAKRRTFPRNVLRIRRSFVSRDVVVRRPARVVSVAGDDILRLQIKGGLRRPERGRKLFVPASGRRRSRKRSYRAGNYIFAARKTTDNVYLGVLVRRARVKARYRLAPAIRRVDRLAARVAAKHMERELRRAIASAGL